MDQTEAQGRPNVLSVAVAVEGGLGLLALFIGWWRGESPWHLISWQPPAMLWGTLAAVPPLVLLVVLRHVRFGPLRALRRVVDRMADELFAGCTAAQLLFIALLAGLGEELLFRGVIQQVLAERLGEVPGLILAGVLFGAAHFISVAYFLLAALLGCYLGWLWIAADHNLLVPIVTHAAYDFAALLYLLRSRAQP